MGIMILEQSGGVRCEDGIDKNQKKRRSNRRFKQSSGVTDWSQVDGHGLHNNNNNSMSTSNSLNQQEEDNNVSSTLNTYQNQHACTTLNHFDPHWSFPLVNHSLQRGHIFQATLRVNAHNRLEAYCTIQGVPIDILITGIPRQNRAVEGDVVAVKVDPPQLWSKMKGSAGSGNSSSPINDRDLSADIDIICESSKGKVILNVDSRFLPMTNCLHFEENGSAKHHTNANGFNCSGSDPSGEDCTHGENEVIDSAKKLHHAVISSPYKRPTGKVVAIIEPSPRRGSVVGFLDAKWLLYSKENRKNTNLHPPSNCNYIHLAPTDPKLPKMIVPVGTLPSNIKKRLDDGDSSVERELVAARIDNWTEESLLPQASIMRTFGRGGEVEPRIEAVLFENAISCSDFSFESLFCLPDESWQIPKAELQRRKDIRNLCVFTIDPSTATDLDDALSVERLSNDVYRVGVHIADVSYFVQPDTPLDVEAQGRSTSVYMLQQKLPMLPALLSENLGSLVPGVDRLTFSIFWDLNASGNVFDRWIGRTVIRSCCKLSYEHAQDIIDGRIAVNSLNKSGTNGFPQLHGQFTWNEVFQSIRSLNEISKTLKDNRLANGALRLDNAKVVFLLDKYGDPFDSVLCERKDSNFLVEEFMLLANSTAAEVISRAFPDGALLRRHPEPNMRKLREFETFCIKHGLELDVSSSYNLCRSLETIKEKLKEDSVFYDILINFATKPMQLAKYFCTGDMAVPEDGWGHYALAVPLYTHFTSPLRRYADIVVHRTLSAAIEAERMLFERQSKEYELNQIENDRCFTGMVFDKHAFESVEGQQALVAAALKYKLPCKETLTDVASYCNQKKLASRQVKDAVDKLYMWVLLRNKEILVSEARVLGIGPRFMSIYVQKLAIERRIYYDDVDGLMAEWLEATSTLVLTYVHNSKRFQRRGSSGRQKALEEVALICSPCNLEQSHDASQNDKFGKTRESRDFMKIDPSVFPLTIRVLSTIPVALHAVGGDDGPLDIVARLYVSSYFK